MPQIVVLHDPLTPQEHLQLGLNYEKKDLLKKLKNIMKKLQNPMREDYSFSEIYI